MFCSVNLTCITLKIMVHEQYIKKKNIDTFHLDYFKNITKLVLLLAIINYYCHTGINSGGHHYL